jgi:hypothetical protein
MRERNEGFIKYQSFRAGNQEVVGGKSAAFFEGNLENTPHTELVAGIRKTLAGIRANFETRHSNETFDPVEKLSFLLTPLQRDPSQAHKDLSIAWDAVSFKHLKGQYQRGTQTELEIESRKREQYITLEPKAVKSLDALTEAVNIPHERGQATIDILKNIPQAREGKINKLMTYVKRLMPHQKQSKDLIPAKEPPEASWLILLKEFLSEIFDENPKDDRKP